MDTATAVSTSQTNLDATWEATKDLDVDELRNFDQVLIGALTHHVTPEVWRACLLAAREDATRNRP